LNAKGLMPDAQCQPNATGKKGKRCLPFVFSLAFFHEALGMKHLHLTRAVVCLSPFALIFEIKH
jgi:hypothetical protein